MDMFFIMDENHNPVAVENTRQWAQWMFDSDRNDDRRVGWTQIGSVYVSTVFLGIAYSYRDDKPLLFETAIFGPDTDTEFTRCCTWEEALAQHEAACEKFR